MTRPLQKIVFVTLLGLSCLSCQTKFVRDFIKPKNFEKEKWANTTFDGNGKFRPSMARDLIDRKVLVGKNRNEIIELLGKNESSFSQKENVIIYTLEDFYGNNIDPIGSEQLRINLNQEDKVEKTEIILQP